MSHRRATPHQAAAGGWAPPAGCVRWHYGDSLTDGKWTDRLGLGNHATLVGSPTIDGNGITCAGGKYARMGDVGDGWTAWSIAAWCYLTSIASTSRTIVSKRSAYNRTGIPYETKVSYVGIAQRAYVRGNVIYATTAAVGTGAWHHLACAWDGLSLTAYLDGAAGTPVAAEVALVDNDAIATIGALPSGSEGWVGYLDDVMLYSEALTAGQIADIIAHSPGRHTA